MSLSDRNYGLDVLRIVAALSVVAFHYGFRCSLDPYRVPIPEHGLYGLFKYGYLGVDVFFVISGYVILRSALSAKTAWQFLKLRAIRIYPAFWICCSATFLCQKMLWPNQSSTLDYIINVPLVTIPITGRFIDGVYWSLLIEMQFYIFVFLVLATGQIRKFEVVSIVWISCVIYSSLIIPENRIVNKALLSAHAPFFISGMMIFSIHQNHRNWVAFIVLLASAMSAWHSCRETALDLALNLGIPVNGHFATFIVLIAMALVYASCYIPVRGGKFQRLILQGGLMTYPLYLVHQRIGYAILGGLLPQVGFTIALLLTVSVMVASALVVANYFEKPIQGRVRQLWP